MLLKFYTLQVDNDRLRIAEEESLPTDKEVKESGMSYLKVWKSKLVELIFKYGNIPYEKKAFGYFRLYGCINYYATSEKFNCYLWNDKKSKMGFENLLIYIKSEVDSKLKFDYEIIKI